MAWWKSYHAEQVPRGGGFLDPEIEAIMLRGFEEPESAAQAVVDRLDILAETKKVPYRPDEIDDRIGLYVFTHIEASRLIRLLHVDGHSERTREVLSNALNAFNRYEKTIEGSSDIPLSDEYEVSIKSVGSFLYTTQFLIQKADGDYEDAMTSLAQGISLSQIAHFLSFCISARNASSLSFHTPFLIASTSS